MILLAIVLEAVHIFCVFLFIFKIDNQPRSLNSSLMVKAKAALSYTPAEIIAGDFILVVIEHHTT